MACVFQDSAGRFENAPGRFTTEICRSIPARYMTGDNPPLNHQRC